MLELFKLLLGKGTEGFRTRQVSRDEDKIIGLAWSGCSALTGSLGDASFCLWVLVPAFVRKYA